jgi:hypothetical protein
MGGISTPSLAGSRRRYCSKGSGMRLGFKVYIPNRLIQRYSVGHDTIPGMGKPPMRILTGDRPKCLSNGLLQGLQRSCRLGSQARLDLGPAFFDGGEIGRIRRQIEQPDASGGTSSSDARHFMRTQIIQNEELTWAQLRQQHLLEKGQKDRAIREAFDRHGGNHPRETQRAEHGHMAASIDGLCRQRSLAPRRTGVEMGHRLMAPSFIEKDEVVRSARLDGVLKHGPLPVDLRPLLLGGAKSFFCEASQVWPMHGSPSPDSP